MHTPTPNHPVVLLSSGIITVIFGVSLPQAALSEQVESGPFVPVHYPCGRPLRLSRAPPKVGHNQNFVS